MDEVEDETIEIDASVPREAVYGSFTGRPGPCPKCGSELHRSHQTYMVATRRGRQLTDTFMMSGGFGWFCQSCPVVVINPEEVTEMMSFSMADWDTGTEFAVLGIIDLDAVPKGQRDVPFDELDNLPLVEFSNLGLARRSKGRGKAKAKKAKRPKRPKRRRR